jgi:lambda family phage portal protein
MLARLIDNLVGTCSPERGLRRAAARQAMAQLASFNAAEKGRRNKDWRAPLGSADAAIIPDSITLNARSREMERNSWIAKAGKRAKVRNVVGRGIVPVPVAKDAAGNELKALNRKAESLFLRWASDKTACDVERRRTFWRQQRMCVSEKFVAGEHLLMWQYRPHPRNVGLCLRGYEPEQLDTTIQSYEGREVRGGVEIDAEGAPVAYHLYERNPYDYLNRVGWKSVRVPAWRVFHYFDPERVMQARGVTDTAPVMQDMRDFRDFQSSTLWRARMEACIGAVIKQLAATAGGGVPGIGPLQSGDTGATPSGMPTFDMVPGMVARLAPGEDISFVNPSTPGSQYDPFTTVTLRGISAGLGMSRGSLTRESEGDYSSARQDMLEDEREIGPEQDSLVDDVVMPVYELWYQIAWLEGKFVENGLPLINEAEYLADPHRFTEAEYIFPVRPWIDPEKEANAAEKLIELRLATRKELVASRGGRFATKLSQIAEEKKDAAAANVTFPEDVAAAAALAKATAPSGHRNPAAGGARTGTTPGAAVMPHPCRRHCRPSQRSPRWTTPAAGSSRPAPRPATPTWTTRTAGSCPTSGSTDVPPIHTP